MRLTLMSYLCALVGRLHVRACKQPAGCCSTNQFPSPEPQVQTYHQHERLCSEGALGGHADVGAEEEEVCVGRIANAAMRRRWDVLGGGGLHAET